MRRDIHQRIETRLQSTVKTATYPLIGILQIAETGYSSMHGEYGAVTAGLMASSMIGALYFWPFALSVRQAREGRFDYRLALSLIAVVLVSVIGSITAGNELALMASTSLFVLTLLSISAILAARLIVVFVKRLRRR